MFSDRIPSERYQLFRASIQRSCHCSSLGSPGLRIAGGFTKYSISICSNSRVRNMKLPGVISLRKDLPICAIPNGSFLFVVSRTFLKLTNIPWAVSGLRYASPDSSSTAPIVVRNIRLNCRGSVKFLEPHSGHLPPSILSALNRALHWRQSTSGSENVASCPEYFQASLFIRIPASSPTTSSRSYTTERHQVRFTL